MRLDCGPLVETIARAVAIKAEIVGRDEREAGLRSLLNFGHTFGHAIESVAGYRRIRHGEAVAVGMVIASQIARASDICDTAAADRLRETSQTLKR